MKLAVYKTISFIVYKSKYVLKFRCESCQNWRHCCSFQKKLTRNKTGLKDIFIRIPLVTGNAKNSLHKLQGEKKKERTRGSLFIIILYLILTFQCFCFSIWSPVLPQKHLRFCVLPRLRPLLAKTQVRGAINFLLFMWWVWENMCLWCDLPCCRLMLMWTWHTVKTSSLLHVVQITVISEL